MRVVFWTVCSLATLAGCTAKSVDTAPKQPERGAEHEAEAALREPTVRPTPSSVERAMVSVPKDARFVVFGGGSEPLSNQISLAQDLKLVTSLLAGPGVTLFASGPGALVSVDQEPAAPRDVRMELAKLFGLPGTLGTRYEAAALESDGPATSEQVLHALTQALERGQEPLFVYGAAHGERGEEPRDNAIGLWGGWSVRVHELSELLDRLPEAPRPVRFVLTSCYGGGFAELAFKDADEHKGARSPEVCGLFAAPWDDEASGCDPNPDRRGQESYAIHFLHALEGKDRRGKSRLSEIDLDGDGRVGLLEAHTFARSAARSFDIPTTTSERYLRSVAQGGEKLALDPLAAPEEVAVVRSLGHALELDDEASARLQLRELDRIREDAHKQVSEAQLAEEDSYHALRIAVLERYPLLEHPWEERAQELVKAEAKGLFALLTASELAQAHDEAVRELDEAVVQEDGVRVERARVLRLVRAFETLRLSSALKKQGGKRYEHFRALRTCESWVPPLRAAAR